MPLSFAPGTSLVSSSGYLSPSLLPARVPVLALATLFPSHSVVLFAVGLEKEA